MNHIIWVFIVSVSAAPAVARDAERIVSLDGFGPVRISMTVPEAEAALKAKLNPFDPNDPAEHKECWLTERADGSDPLVAYMVENSIVARIEISDPTVATEKGIKVGSTEDQARKAYGPALDISPHSGDYDFPHQGAYLTVYSLDKKKGVLFEVIEGKIRALRTGTLPAIRYYEGCL